MLPYRKGATMSIEDIIKTAKGEEEADLVLKNSQIIKVKKN